MAIVLRGKRKGERVDLHQWANDWVSLADGSIVSPTSLEYTTWEMVRIEADGGKGKWPYAWSFRNGMFRLRRTS